MDQAEYLALCKDEGVDTWRSVMLLYRAALKELDTKIAILNEEFQHTHQYNPIEYVKSRVKSPESIVKKLKRYGYEDSMENMVTYCNDIAGLRIVCSFTSDIYRMADMIGRQNDITVISIKDYIKSPKESGYKSYHMLVSVPIFLSDKVVDTKVEIQIRTIAMDFWASIEHQLHYKNSAHIPDSVRRELFRCAETIAMTDREMEEIAIELQALD
jgi:putative GTP pyrophosphokinase